MVCVPKEEFLFPPIPTSRTCDIDPKLLDDDLGSAMGTGTLIANDLVPDGLPAFSKAPAQEALHCISGARY
jgi:hypothetical protein